LLVSDLAKRRSLLNTTKLDGIQFNFFVV
jgi:hypothetical protein